MATKGAVVESDVGVFLETTLDCLHSHLFQFVLKSDFIDEFMRNVAKLFAQQLGNGLHIPQQDAILHSIAFN